MSQPLFEAILRRLERLERRLGRRERAPFAVMQAGDGAPTHEAAESVLYWDSTNNVLYVNNDGSTSWTQVGP